MSRDFRALGLAALLTVVGSGHFTRPGYFDDLVPPQLPGAARTYVYGSGAAEIAVAALLVNPRTRRLGGTLAALLFIAVFPANIRMAGTTLTDPEATTAAKLHALLRLPLQIPMIGAALAVRR